MSEPAPAAGAGIDGVVDTGATEVHGRKAEAKPQKKGFVQSAKTFIKGPPFRVIPDPNATRKHGEEEDVDYEAEIKAMANLALDEDDYGLRLHDLAPLPFKPPAIYKIVARLGLDFYGLCQAMLVIFIAIMIENAYRYQGLGDSYKTWSIITNIIMILYPLITMMFLVLYACEYCYREYWYYRFMSMRILIDWHNEKIYKCWFIYYFVATWALINAWLIYGIWWSWPNTNSWFTFGLVNLQTLSLLVSYYKCHEWEKELVSVNKFIERNPAAANALLDAVYIVEEEALRKVCYKYAVRANRLFWRAFPHYLSCGLLYRDWHKDAHTAVFDVDVLREVARNRREVDDRLGVMEAEQGTTDKFRAGYQQRKEDAQKQAKQAAAGDDAGDTISDQNAVPAKTLADLDEPEPSWFVKIIMAAPYHIYHQLYATTQIVIVTFTPGTHSWPFKADVPYFRFLFVFEMVMVVVVGFMVWLGVQSASTSEVCKNGFSDCDSCKQFIDAHVINGTCVAPVQYQCLVDY